MKYTWGTPFDELSDNLKVIVEADKNLDDDARNTGDDNRRWTAVVKCFEHTGLQGKLIEAEMDYLEDSNMHTICHYFEGWDEADYLAYCKKRDAPPKWAV